MHTRNAAFYLRQLCFLCFANFAVMLFTTEGRSWIAYKALYFWKKSCLKKKKKHIFTKIDFYYYNNLKEDFLHHFWTNNIVRGIIGNRSTGTRIVMAVFPIAGVRSASRICMLTSYLKMTVKVYFSVWRT